MKKLVVLKLDGDFNQGFSVSLEIGEDGKRADVELNDSQLRLPAIPKLPNIYQEWCRSYRGLDGYRIKVKKGHLSNVKVSSLKEDCQTKADNIKLIFTNWLKADSFYRIKEKCLIHLSPEDEIRFIIRTTEFQLRKLPWHLWDLFDSYPDAEIGLSSFDSRSFTRSYRNRVRILIVLGNSEGINVVEDEKLLKEYCQDAELVVLTEPSVLELNEYIWDERGWDILFFSGHSQTESEQGIIYLNSGESLTIAELKESLKRAVRGGLKLAFFNSCDGLGIAAELENLHIPQVIVMREPVPDKLANHFLKYFFDEFTGGKSFYKSVNIARRKLQGLEKKYPCASWLPVIVQNLLEIPPTWQSLGAIAKNPYLGLAAFKEEDAANFFGREFVTRQLVSTVNEKPFFAVVGASGSGKSSVVFAGLIPQLKQNKKRDWLIVDFRPGNNPFKSLAIGLLQGFLHLEPHPNPFLGRERELAKPHSSPFLGRERELAKPHPNPLLVKERGQEFESLSNVSVGKEREEDLNSNRLTELELEVELRSGKNSLENFVEPFIIGNQKLRLAIIVDQFEELFTLCSDTDSRHLFINNLLNLTEIPGCHVIITLRADFYAEALSYRLLADALQDAQVNLAAMDEEELRAAIEKPAGNYSVSLEEGLSQRLIDAVLESPSNLPLLEFTLTQLWGKQHDGWLTHQAYEDIGGVETALANHAEAIYAQLSLVDKEKVQQIFVQLVQPSEISADIRRLAIREEVGNWDLVSRLADGRLVVTNSNQVTGVETVEIVHEALIKNWRRLQKWMLEDRDFRYWQEHLRVFIRQWEKSDKDEGALLRGKPLIDAEEWLLQRSNQFSSVEQGFIDLSLDLRNRETREKEAARRKVIVWLVCGLIAALILAAIAEDKRRESEINQINTLSLTAKTLLNSGNQVEALNSTLEANNKLIELRNNLDAETKNGLFSSLLENFNSIREFNSLNAHDGAVNSVDISDDGKLLASGSDDNKIKIWRRDGKILQTLLGHKQGIFSVIFSPDDKFMIAASFDNTVSLWRYNSTTGLFTNRPFVRISEPDGLWAIAFNPNNNIIATASENGKVKFWTLDGKLIKTIPAHDEKIWGLNFSADGKYLATASADNTIKIWDSQGRFLKTLTGHKDKVLSVNFSPDSKYIVSGSEDKTVKLWDLTGKLLHTFEGHTNDVLDVRFNPDGKLIASASADDTVRVWDVALKEEYQQVRYGSKAIEVKFSPDGKTFATASGDKTVKLSYLKGILPTFTGNSVSISPDSETVAIANQNIITLQRRNGNLIRRFDVEIEEINKVIFSPTGKYFATIDSENQIKVWNLKGKLLRNWQGHDVKNNPMDFDAIQDIDISPDGKTIATISRVDKQVKLWNLQGKLIKSWQFNDYFATSIKFSPGGETLAIAEGKNVTLWNLEGNLLRTITGHKDSIAALSFNSDGRIIATASNDKTVKLWQHDTGKLLQTLAHQDNVYAVTFSADDSLVISGSTDKSLNLWTMSGKLLNTIEAHQGKIKEIEFSRDNNIFASVDMEDNVILWNLDIDELQQRGCDWLKDYLRTNVDLDRKVCD
ncbi:WD40 repeat-containing protein [Rivularia sp. PCC 7116]|uniref:nSTAND1 domain-containing NTPase n=1 Tax=Rivularia sp. PCC 7116 TaxID=373994 RepID=UPI00029F384B|nr:CHAT domain-containing protein [Rivularia sp. PCC 7116]AFY55337.1 WD40 repeat-containing protein [Rivularia sp. PCC 7116]